MIQYSNMWYNMILCEKILLYGIQMTPLTCLYGKYEATASSLLA